MSSALTMGILNHYAYRLFDELQLLRYAVNKSTIPQVSALSPEIHAIASKIYNYAENYKFNVMASPVLSQLGAIATLANINDGVGMILKAVSEVEEIASKTLTKAIPGTSITLDIHEVSVATYLLLGYFSSSASPIDPPQDISHARKAIEYINEGKTGEAAFETIRFVRQLREYGSVHFSQPLAPLT
ncbi:MAG: hypothetical protein LC104_19075 [Bacteroidales bacterium]|nr:hypothetical protein [Bacteroidales bacterium]